ncbi:MAG: DNA replication complex subunit Gins51 [Promethearchaeota archaeon]
MNIKNSYEKLYQHWFKELNQLEISELKQSLYEEYTKLVAEINNISKESLNIIQNKIISSYQHNFGYLLNDLLKMREIKILNSALALKEINMEYLYEAEKLFYNNLVSSIKGFEKVKKMSGSELIQRIVPVIEKKEAVESSIREDEIEKPAAIKRSEAITAEVASEESNDALTLIRFLKKCPPLVGVDLNNYGPFEKEDIAYLPNKNAKILIFEKFAELIELS